MAGRIHIDSYNALTGAIDWHEELAQPGLPWDGGQVRMETRSGLSFEEAVGYGEPGKFFDLAKSPEVKMSLDRPIRALAALPYRIEEPALQDWASEEDIAAHERQWELQQRVWWRLTRSRRHMTRFIREVLVMAAKGGVYLGELVCDEEVHDFEGFPLRYWIPRVPSFRAPWTIRHWLTQNEQPIGVILDVSRASDFSAGTGSGWIVLPWRKVIHIAAEQIGSNLDGESWLTASVSHLATLKQTWKTEALALEVNGLGEAVITVPKSTSAADKETYRTHLKRRKAAQVPGLVVPEGTTVDIVSPQTTVPDFTPFRQGLSTAILQSLDSADKRIAVEGTGAYSARSEAAADARESYDYLAMDYVAAAFEQILDRAIAANYPGDYAVGRVYVAPVQWGNVEVRDPDRYIDSITTAKVGGLLDDPDIGPVVRELLDLPVASALTDSGRVDSGGEQDDPFGGEWVSTAEVAKRLGVKASAVVRWAKKGLIRAKMMGARWRVELASVKAFIEDAPEASAVRTK